MNSGIPTPGRLGGDSQGPCRSRRLCLGTAPMWGGGTPWPTLLRISCVRFTRWPMASWEATWRKWEGFYREIAAREPGREGYFAVGTRFPSGGWGCGRLHGSDAGGEPCRARDSSQQQSWS